MTVGVAPRQADLIKGTGFVGERVAEDSIFAVLHRDGHRLFPDDMFADLYNSTGRRSVPPQIVATVMVLQRWFGLSDREAVQAFEFDTRWKYACGGLDFDSPGFVHTVLVYTRARLAASDRPRRIFEVTLEAARQAGVVSAKRVLDSTPLYDAVATQDTVTMIRSAVRQLLAAAGTVLEAELRAVLTRDDDYSATGKPACDWDDADARRDLVAELAADAHACLAVLDGRDLPDAVVEIGELLATVVGQDLEQDDDGRFRIARRVAKDRVISTVDPDARHGHKTSARGFDGYKGHIAEDPDSEIITDTTVTPGNAGDGSVAETLIEDLLDRDNPDDEDDTTVYGDSAYGGGEFQQRLDDEHIDSRCRTQPPAAPKGHYGKDQFRTDLEAGTVTCPNDVTVTIRRRADGAGTARFAGACTDCPLREACTKAAGGRTITVGVHEAALAKARERQKSTKWQDDYRATRPKVERVLPLTSRDRIRVLSDRIWEGCWPSLRRLPVSSTRKSKRFLSPEQKYDLFVRMLSGQLSQADAAAEAGVDRSTISNLRKAARDGALAGLSTKPGRSKASAAERSEVAELRAEVRRLQETVIEQAIELAALRGKASWG